MDGLGRALWLGDERGAIVNRERAYAGSLVTATSREHLALRSGSGRRCTRRGHDRCVLLLVCARYPTLRGMFTLCMACLAGIA